MASNRYYAFIPQETVNSPKLNALPATARWIYVVMIAERHGLDTLFTISYRRIRKITGFSTSTIRLGIVALKEAGLLEYIHGGLQQNPNQYRLESSWLQFQEKAE